MKNTCRIEKLICLVAVVALLVSLAPMALATGTDPCAGGQHKGPFTYVLIKAATCTEDGSQDKYCSACGQKIGTEPIIHIGHQYEEVLNPVTSATCTTDGLQQKKSICRVCGYQESVTDVTIPALGHNWGEWKVTKAATCEADGVETRICARDSSHVETRVVTKLGHKWDSGKVTTAPTCAKPGVKTFTCQNDPSHTKTEEVPINPTAHNWDSGKITTAPTCATPGVKTYTCLNDSSHFKTESVPIDPNAHKWGEWKVVTPATCEAKGKEERTCANCGKVESRELPATGHDWDAGKVTKQPTWTAPGEMVYTCKNNPAHTKTVKLDSITKPNNTVCAFGPRLRDSSTILYPNVTDLWYMYTPFSVQAIKDAPGSKVEYELVASNTDIVGKVTLSIVDDELIVDYTLASNTIKITYEFFTILNQITDLNKYEPEDLRSLALQRREPMNIQEYFGDDDQLVLYFCSRCNYSYSPAFRDLAYNSVPHQQLLQQMLALID